MFSLDKNDFKKALGKNENKFTCKDNPFSKNDLAEIEKLSFTNNLIHLSRSNSFHQK